MDCLTDCESKPICLTASDERFQQGVLDYLRSRSRVADNLHRVAGWMYRLCGGIEIALKFRQPPHEEPEGSAAPSD